MVAIELPPPMKKKRKPDPAVMERLTRPQHSPAREPSPPRPSSHATFLMRKNAAARRMNEHIERLAKETVPITCHAAGAEPYLRRAITKLGWQMTKEEGYDVRFDVSDTEKPRNMRLYNHFPENRRITTKAGLCNDL